MTVHAPIPTAQRERQSLADLVRKAHWDLLQDFARLELSLAALLREKSEVVPTTFGHKMNSTIQIRPALEPFKPLGEIRNILAHALIETVKRDDQWVIMMQVADHCLGRNALCLTRDEFDRWRKDASNDLKRALETAA